MRRAISIAVVAVAAALAGCTQEGTGVELLIDAGGVTLDRLQIVANYDGRSVPHTVDVVSTSSLDVIAQLPNESTTVTFELTAFAAGSPVGHGMSEAIAVTPHHLAQAMITLVPGAGTDGFTGSPDLAGALWSHQQGALPPSTGAIRGIWASSGTDVYAVGTATGSPNTNTFHSTNHGATWTPQLAMGLSVDLNAVGGTSSSDVYLVGDGGTILHGSGTTWATQNSPSGAVRLLAVWAIAPSDVYIAGASNTVMHNAGSGWITQTAVGSTELRGVWGVAGHIWAVGSGGTILKSTGTATWTLETSGTPNELRAIFGTSATDVWVVGDGVVLHSDGSGTWTPAADGVPTDVNLRAIGGRPNGGPVWAVGNAWTIVRRDTSAWVVEPTGLPVDDPAGDVLQAIFAPSAAEVFAGGAGQTILHRP